DAPLDLLPASAAELVDDRPRALGARVLLHAVERLHRHLELVAALIEEDHELPAAPADLERLQALEAADPVLLVDDEVPDLEVAEVGEEAARAVPAAPRVEVHLLGEDVAVGEHGEAGGGQVEPARQGSDPHVERGSGRGGKAFLP